MTMKSSWHLPVWRLLAAACLGSALATTVAAQSDPAAAPSEESDDPDVPFLGYRTSPWIDYRASTPFEGHARGLSEIIRARAEFNQRTAEAMETMTEAARKQMRNREEWTHTYFRLREANRTYREKEDGPRPTTEDIVRYAEMGKPERLSPGEIDPVTGSIAWPEALRGPAFDEDRARVESLFGEWTRYGSLSLQHRREIRETTDAMLGKLQERIHRFPAPDYMAARRFLESLAYEAYLAAG